MEPVWIVIIIALIAFLVFVGSSKKEGYGGPVKRIQRIPENACRGICDQHWRRDMMEFGYLNADWINKKHQACINVCHYSNYHRT